MNSIQQLITKITYIKHISGQLPVSWLTRTQEYAIECYLPQDINKCFIESLTMQMMQYT